MDINTLLQEALTPEMAKVVQEGIATAVSMQISEALQEAKDAATAQAIVVQKQADEIEDIKKQYDEELKKAAKQIAETEKFHTTEINKAVKAVMNLTEEKAIMEDHYVGQLQEAVEYVTEQSDTETVKSLQESIAKYVEEIATIKESAQSFGEHVRTETLAEMETLVQEATQEFITEHQVKFDALDKMARYESTLNTIKESFEKIGLGLSEDIAYSDLQEQVKSKEGEIAHLKESIDKQQANLFTFEKEAKFIELTETLSDLQKSKMRKLSESIVASDINEYARTMGYIIEATTESKDDTKTIVEQKEPEKEVIVESKDDTKTPDSSVQSHIDKMFW